MDYNKLLVSLVNQCKSLVTDNKKYNDYVMLFKKLDDILVDFKNVSKIESSDIELFNDPLAVAYINGIDYYSQVGYLHDKSEIINAVNWLKEKLSFEFNKDDDMRKIKNKISELELISSKLNSGNIDEELFFNFIRECYNDDLINLETAVGLNFFVARECSSKQLVMEDTIEIETEEVIVLEKNTESISEELRIVFNNYGYDYDKMRLSDQVRMELENYAKIDVVDYVLSILRKHNITVENFEDRQGVIKEIIIFGDSEVLAGIDKFIEDNNCTLMDLLEFANIFHKRKKKFSFRGKNGGSGGSEKTVSGRYDDFIKNVALYKKCNNFPDEYKMSKIDFENRGKFFSAPHDKIMENLSVLVLYGVLEDGLLPKATMSLIGANLQYLLDRCIEAGILDYCKKNLSFLRYELKNFRWYKIKRAIDLGQNLFRARGLKRELRNDDEFYGISFSTNKSDIIIHQKPMTNDEMDLGTKEIHPDLFNAFAEDPNCDLEKIRFDLLYKYRTYEVFDLFKKTDISYAKLSLIKAAISKRVSINSCFLNESNDEYIKLLDSAILYDNNGDFYNCKIDDKTYQFVNSGYPGMRVLISRNKVLQLVRVLKEEGLWLDDSFSQLDKENLFLTILLKDTIVSDMEMQVVRVTVRNILNGELKRIVSERKGVGR